MFIHWILQKIIIEQLAQIDLEALGSLISSIEWQCLDENHNRDSAHILHNIFEFRIHIYSANTMKKGGGWIPLPERIAGTKAVINHTTMTTTASSMQCSSAWLTSPENTIADRFQICRN